MGLSVWVPASFISVLVVVSFVVEYARFYLAGVGNIFSGLFGSMLREEEHAKITGSTYIILGAYLCCVLLKDDPHISFMVLTLFILGDAVAALVGKRFGRIEVAGKTLEGSLACFGVCLILCLVLFPALPMLLDAWNGRMPLSLALATSLAITLLELIPIKLADGVVVNDNMAVPPLAGMAMKFLYPLLSGTV